MSEQSKNKEALEILLATLEENPDLWETRRKTAKLFYEDKKYLEAADILWGAPEIPATDVDIAFSLKLISRVKPNRSIRLIYEVLRRNHGKPLKNIAIARALNNVGLYMEASRFYGAAIADDIKYFDLGFERQMLWMDDSNRLVEEWLKSDQDASIPLKGKSQECTGGMIRPLGIHNEIDAIVDGVENPNPVRSKQPGAPIITQPLVSPASAVAPVKVKTQLNPLLYNNQGPPPSAPPQTSENNSLLAAGTAQVSPAAEQQVGAPKLIAQTGSTVSKPLLVATVEKSGPHDKNSKLLTPGVTDSVTDVLIAGNAEEPVSSENVEVSPPADNPQQKHQDEPNQPQGNSPLPSALKRLEVDEYSQLENVAQKITQTQPSNSEGNKFGFGLPDPPKPTEHMPNFGVKKK